MCTVGRVSWWDISRFQLSNEIVQQVIGKTLGETFRNNKVG